MNAKADLDLNDVALFARVVQAQSFSAAARERGVPVSTVSRRISRLEAALGARLLERTTRRLRLTDTGRAYFGHAQRAVDDLAQGGAQVRELQREPSGRVRILAPSALSAAITPAIFSYLAAHPGVSIDLELAARHADPLGDGFDLAIVTGRVADTPDAIARPVWGVSRKLLYASPRYLAAAGRPRRLDDLARHACIATAAADGVATWQLVHGRRKRRVTFHPRLYVSEFAAAQRAVLAGVGIALIPEVHCLRDVAARRLVHILDGYEGETGGVSLLYRAHRSLTAAVRTCLDHLAAALPATDPGRR